MVICYKVVSKGWCKESKSRLKLVYEVVLDFQIMFYFSECVFSCAGHDRIAELSCLSGENGKKLTTVSTKFFYTNPEEQIRWVVDDNSSVIFCQFSIKTYVVDAH